MVCADARWPSNGRASWMRASNGCADPAEAVDRQRRRDVRRARELLGVEERQREDRRGRLRAVDERQPFLRVQRHGGEPRSPQRLFTRDWTGRAFDLPFPDEHERQVRERREVAARSDGSPRRDNRVHSGIEQREQRLERLDPHPREPERQHVRPERHRRADDADRQRLADAGRVAAQEIDLQRVERAPVDADLGEGSEPGVDAVHGRVQRGKPIDDAACSLHAGPGLGRKRRRRAIGDGHQTI